MSPIRNPFASFGRPIEDDKDFIGRKIPLSEMRERISGPRPSSLALIGARSTGKTSLVLRVLHSEMSELIARRIVPVWISISPKSLPETFMRDMIEYCYDALDQAGLSTPTIQQAADQLLQTSLQNLTFLKMRKVFRLIAQEEIHLLIVLDGFDNAADLFRNNVAQFNQLVNLEGSLDHKVSYIITSIQTVKHVELTVTGSSFLDSRCHKIYTSLYDEFDLVEYETKLEYEADVKLDTAQLNFLYTVCGSHPYLLALFGNALHIQVKDNRLPNVEEVYKSKGHDIHAYFDSLVKRLKDVDSLVGYNNVALLWRIATGNSIKLGEFNDSYLRLWNLATPTDDDKYSLFSAAFQQRLVENQLDSGSASQPTLDPAGSSRTTPLEVGNKLNGRYLVTKVIQDDPRSLSYVYEAQQIGLPNSPSVIIKEPSFFVRGAGTAKDEYQLLLTRFRREIEILSKYRGSPEIPMLVEVVEERYLVQLRCPGESLQSLIETKNLLTPQRATQIAKAVCTVLHRLVEKDQIFHRDLKPAHIFIDEQDNVRIIDFGLAWIDLSPNTHATIGPVLGTYHYMAPEQTKPHEDLANSIDQRADIFALGASLYEAITGLKAFPRGMFVQNYTDFSISMPEPSYRLPKGIPTIPENLEDILMKMMQIDRENRFANWMELYTALELAEKKD